MWLVAVGLVVSLVYLRLHGPARNTDEGWLLAAGPAFMMGWTLGFVVHGLAF